MYKNIYYDRKNNIVHLWDDLNGYVHFEYEPYAYRKKSNGEYKSIFGDCLEKVYDFNDNDSSLFESDVLPETRILIDLYGDSDDVSKDHIILNYDIEVGSNGGFSTPDDPWQPIISIAYKNSKTNIREVLILDINNEITDKHTTDEKGDIIINRFDTEKDLILHFLKRYEEINPTILTGWNINGYDTPYLFNRIQKVFDRKTASKLSPVGIAYVSSKRNDNSFKTVIAGVSCLDYLNLFKTFTYKEYPNYRLGTIGMLEVGIDKIEYSGNLNDLFKEDINKFVKYNLTDVDIVDAIDNKNKFIELATTICHVCHVPYEFIEYSSKFLEGSLLTYLRRKNLVAPNRPRRQSETDSDSDVGFEGAYVKQPIAGMYEWVFDLDLVSLYPSIIMSLNISPETLMGKVYSHVEPEKPKENGKKDEMIPAHASWSPEDFCSNKLKKVFLTEAACLNNNDIGNECISIDEFRKNIEAENLSIASNGALYTQDKVGLLGDIIDTWFKQRVEFRNLEKKYGNEKNETLYKFYNKRQKVQKILLNSLYGVLGLSVFRFYNLINAEAVTLTGQTIIKTSAKMGNFYYNSVLNTKDVDYNIYIDTDSVFYSAKCIIEKTMTDVDLNNDKQMIEATKKVASKIQSVINDGYKSLSKKMLNLNSHRFDIKQELVSRRAIWITKKRYIQWIVDEVGIPKDEIDIKGLDVIRSSFPIKFREFMFSTTKDESNKKVESGILVDFIKQKITKQEIDDKILKFKNEIGTYPIEEIARNTSVKEISKFEKLIKNEPIGRFPKVKDENGRTITFPSHVKSAINFNKFIKHHKLDKKVEYITNGEKIKYVYLKNNKFGLEEIAFRGYKDPIELLEFIQTYSDGVSLYDRELQTKIYDFYDALKWEYPSNSNKIIDKYFSMDDDYIQPAVKKPNKQIVQQKQSTNNFFEF